MPSRFAHLTSALVFSLFAHFALVYSPASTLWLAKHDQASDEPIWITTLEEIKVTPPPRPRFSDKTEKPVAAAPAPLPEKTKQLALKAAPPAQKPSPFSSLDAVAGDPLMSVSEREAFFHSYFAEVRSRIHKEVWMSEGLDQSAVHGFVSLLFTLRSDGSVERVWVQEDRSEATPNAKAYAVWCVENASPFDPFPKGTGLDRISFQISLLFEATR